MTRAEEVAAGLTKAQQHILREPYGHYSQFDNGRVRYSLISMGLVESGQGLRVTRLGREVLAVLRAHAAMREG